MHRKLQPFINNLVLPGFKYRGRIKQEEGKNTRDEGSTEAKKKAQREGKRVEQRMK